MHPQYLIDVQFHLWPTLNAPKYLSEKNLHQKAWEYEFLELPKYKMKKFQKLKFVKYENMNYDIKQELLEYFKPKNEKLFSLINKKFKWDDDIEN